jgi:hypothetical protein
MFLKNIRASLASFIHPGVSLPFAGNETRPVQIVSASTAPVAAAGGPGTVTRGNPPELNSLIQAIATVRKASPSARAQAVAARPAPRSVAKIAAPLTASPAPVASTSEPENDTAAQIEFAREALAKSEVALATAKENARSELRAQKPTDLRGALTHSHAMISGGFNEQPAVAALSAALGRGRSPVSLAQRASLSLAVVGGSRTSAPTVPTAVTSPSAFRDRAQAITAESKSLEKQMRTTGVYDAKSLARQAQLKTELAALVKSSRPQ